MESSKVRPDFQRMSALKTEYEKAARDEEIYWKEKSKVNCLTDGDRNTKFFHEQIKTKRM